MGQGSLRAARSPWAWSLNALMQLGCQEYAAAATLADKALQCLGSAGYQPPDLVSSSWGPTWLGRDKGCSVPGSVGRACDDVRLMPAVAGPPRY